MNAHDFDALKLPPHSVEAEQSVLGALMLENTAYDRIIGMLNEQDFYRAYHKSIWRQIVHLIDENKPADVVTVAEALESLGLLDQAGGLAYLADLAQNTPSAANIRRYAEIVREKARFRALGSAAMALGDAIHHPDGRTPSEIAKEAVGALDAISDPVAGGNEPIPASLAMAELLRHAYENTGRGGLETGLADLDQLTGGLEPGQLFILAARPAVGKTAVALTVARHVSRCGSRVAFFSLEMSRQELAARLLAAEAGVPTRIARKGPDMDQPKAHQDQHWDALYGASHAPGMDGLLIDDRAAASVAYIRARARRLDRQARLSLIVIDYMQLMEPADSRATRTEQVGSLSRGLKALAKELRIPIIALAQLNRASEARADKKPMLSDLRDSGELEQDADMVLLLSRTASEGDVLECELAKHRQGATGRFWLGFDGLTMTFSKRYGPPTSAPVVKRRGFDE
jgi:replicative DNA helicase